MDSETIWYEFSPYLYAIAGIVVLEEIGSIAGTCAGLILLAGAARVLLMRWSRRIARSRKGGLKAD
jgi:hypothetical protein